MGQRLDEPDLLRPNAPVSGPPDLEHAEQALFAGQRRDDQRADAVAPDRLVEVGVVLEPVVVEVVRADDGLSGGDRLAGGAESEWLALLVDGGTTDDARRRPGRG